MAAFCQAVGLLNEQNEQSFDQYQFKTFKLETSKQLQASVDFMLLDEKYAKTLAAIFSFYDPSKGFSHPKVETLAEMLGVATRTVQRHVRFLEKFGVLTVKATRFSKMEKGIRVARQTSNKYIPNRAAIRARMGQDHDTAQYTETKREEVEKFEVSPCPVTLNQITPYQIEKTITAPSDFQIFEDRNAMMEAKQVGHWIDFDLGLLFKSAKDRFDLRKAIGYAKRGFQFFFKTKRDEMRSAGIDPVGLATQEEQNFWRMAFKSERDQVRAQRTRESNPEYMALANRIAEFEEFIEFDRINFGREPTAEYLAKVDAMKLKLKNWGKK